MTKQTKNSHITDSASRGKSKRASSENRITKAMVRKMENTVRRGISSPGNAFAIGVTPNGEPWEIVAGKFYGTKSARKSLEESAMKQQPFFCEGCGVQGSVSHLPSDGVYGVVCLLESEHKTLSPKCTASVRQLRVVKTTKRRKHGTHRNV